MKKKIMASTSPKEQKQFGREVKNFNVEKWNYVAKKIVFKGNLARFSQHEDLQNLLLSTGDKILVEASPYDKVWGIGLREDDPNATKPEKWLGQNWLGEVLMKVREELVEQERFLKNEKSV